MALEHLPSYSDAFTLQAIVSAVSGGLVRLPAERRANTMASSLKNVLGKLQLLVSTYVSPATAHGSDSEDEASFLKYCIFAVFYHAFEASALYRSSTRDVRKRQF
jgi:hypothetical protein